MLDQLYFTWEDELRHPSIVSPGAPQYGLLSGYSYPGLNKLDLEVAANEVQQGTVFTRFYKEHVVPSLTSARPDVIAVTIASQHQVLPTLELLQLLRRSLPDTFFVLGGNVVTRLRNSAAFLTLQRFVDQIVVFQGESAFSRILENIGRGGGVYARERLPAVAGDELVPFEAWPTPDFSGIQFDDIVGVPSLSYVSTRGCYWGRCHFCAIPAGWSQTAYAGSAPGDFVAEQLYQMTEQTNIRRVKFVDEAFPPSKVAALATGLARFGGGIEWEAYVRLEPKWHRIPLLEQAREAGCRKLYFGLEQAPTTDRSILGKNDHGDPMLILEACRAVGIKVHLFCMVGHPGSSRADAHATVRFLQDNQDIVDTADLVGFRLDRGTTVPGVRPNLEDVPDWALALPFVPSERGILGQQEVWELESECQEILWDSVPRLLHPLYRLVGAWESLDGTAPKDDRCGS